mmetsp:Transcript_26121/g.60906  ORF Transcript_26121/g.60906 Transcript_26121/m.60906 type:complete len:822 (-) Transcript_26121:226-2691(-)
MAASEINVSDMRSMDAALQAAIRERLAAAAATDGEVSDEVFLGVVKSYNDRRGFGFLACAETAAKFGRDVYMAKTEATLAAAEAASAEGDAVALAAALALIEKEKEKEKEKGKEKDNKDGEKEKEKGEKPPPAPRLAEEDLVRFRVRLSVEGYPQAAAVSRMRKFVGVVSRPPREDMDPDSMDGHGLISCEEAHVVHGIREVPFRRRACGQARLVVGDEVTFCVPEPEAAGGIREAQLVALSKTNRSSGSVLGFFTLDLPRTGGGDDAPPRPSLMLDCHAFGDKLILAGLPEDLDEPELMRFFSKQGATSTIVAHARGCSFASISFPSVVEVARFLGRTAHAFADEKETRIAKLVPLDVSRDVPRLPALPAPSLTVGEEVGSLLVVWSPLVLAVAYAVELRPLGGDSPWATVDVSSNRLGGSTNRFDADCSSCKVTGLHLGSAYEARVSYFTECDTRSEASEASEPAMPATTAGAIPSTLPPASAGAAAAVGLGAKAFGAEPPPLSSPPPPPLPGVPPAAPGAYTPCLGSYAPSIPQSAPPPAASPWYGWGAADPYAPPLHDAYSTAPSLPPYVPTTAWRSLSGMVVPPPGAPEMKPADDFGFAVSIQWPAVLQASAYIVELREAGSATFERFVRAAPEAKIGTLVELRVGGLKPAPGQGRIYVAQVRTVAADGSESVPSPPSWSPPLPPHLPPAPPASAASAGGGILSVDAAECSAGFLVPPPWLGQPPAGDAATARGVPLGPLPAEPPPPPLGMSLAPGTDKPADKGPGAAVPWATPGGPPPPPPGPPTVQPPVPPGTTGARDEAPPEVTGNEDCLILD